MINENKLRSAQQLKPAAKTSLTLKGLPEALCGYSVVDKSVDLIHNPNKVSILKSFRTNFYP
jgi:hypothetical protein